MSVEENFHGEPATVAAVDGYPMKSTAALLNERLGLYLSDEQQRGLAAGLLIGAALAGTVLGWNLTAMIRRG
jgi:hypothetical protein